MFELFVNIDWDSLTLFDLFEVIIINFWRRKKNYKNNMGYKGEAGSRTEYIALWSDQSYPQDYFASLLLTGSLLGVITLSAC